MDATHTGPVDWDIWTQRLNNSQPVWMQMALLNEMDPYGMAPPGAESPGSLGCCFDTLYPPGCRARVLAEARFLDLMRPISNHDFVQWVEHNTLKAGLPPIPYGLIRNTLPVIGGNIVHEFGGTVYWESQERRAQRLRSESSAVTEPPPSTDSEALASLFTPTHYEQYGLRGEFLRDLDYIDRQEAIDLTLRICANDGNTLPSEEVRTEMKVQKLLARPADWRRNTMQFGMRDPVDKRKGIHGGQGVFWHCPVMLAVALVRHDPAYSAMVPATASELRLSRKKTLFTLLDRVASYSLKQRSDASGIERTLSLWTAEQTRAVKDVIQN